MPDTSVENSYCETIEACDTYFENDPRATAFLVLDDDPKSWYLQRATFLIDNLPLRGRKYDRDGTQVWPNGRSKAFPREYREGYDMDEATGEEEIPQHVRDACCEEALAIYEIQKSADKKERLDLQRQGVTGVSYGGTSEQYGGGPAGGGATVGAGRRYMGLMSLDAYNLLARHIARSVPIT